MSNPRLPFLQLASIEEDSPNFQKQVTEQEKLYSAWRDVRSDGNCFYRAVAWGLLEHFCRPFTPVSELETFYRRLFYQETKAVRDEDVSDFHTVLQVILLLIQHKQTNDPGLMFIVGQLLVTDDFTGPLIRVLRYVAWAAIGAFQPDPYFEGMEEMEEMMALLQDGHAAGDLDAIGIANGFDVVLHQVSMGRSNYSVISTVFEPTTSRLHKVGLSAIVPRAPQERPHIHIGLNGGHFMAFYRKGLETLETEEQGKYRVLKDIDEGTVAEYERISRS